MIAVLGIKTGNTGSSRERAKKVFEGYIAFSKSIRNEPCLFVEEESVAQN